MNVQIIVYHTTRDTKKDVGSRRQEKLPASFLQALYGQISRDVVFLILTYTRKDHSKIAFFPFAPPAKPGRGNIRVYGFI